MKYLSNDIYKSCEKVKVKVTVTLKSAKNYEKYTFWDFIVIFMENTYPMVTLFGMVVVSDKGLQTK